MLLTQNATQDDLSAADYRDIFSELREKMSLDKLVAALGSQYSKAQWSKYERDPNMELTRTMRSELRRSVGLPELPLTVEEAVRQASPDAAVWRVGDGEIEHVILSDTPPPTVARVTMVTGGSAPRKRYTRPCVSDAQKRRFLALPTGSTWSDVIEAGLQALEEKK